MALTFTNQGDSLALAYFIGRRVWNYTLGTATRQGDTLVLRLYRGITKLGVRQPNAYNPLQGDTYRNFLGSGGILPVGLATNWKLLSPASWTMASSANAGDTVSAGYPQQTFTYATNADTACGYIITKKGGSRYSATDTVVVLAERFSDGPYTFTTGGGTCLVTPKIIAD